MGAILSIFRRKRKPDYMQIFTELEERITEYESEIASIKKTEARVKGIIFLYTTLLAFAGAFTLWFAFDMDNQALGVIAAYPFIVYILRRLASAIFQRLRRGKEHKVKALKHALATKISALKQETAYDTTRELIDRFDLDSRKARLDSANAHAGIPPAEKDPYAMNDPFHGGSTEALAQRRKSWSHAAQEPEPGNPNFTTLSGSGPAAVGQNIARPDPLAPSDGDPLPVPTPDFYLYYPRSWMDRVVDRLIGNEDERTSKYAIICKRCFFHNGLVLPEEAGVVAFICARCGFFNQPEASMAKPPNRPVSADTYKAIRLKSKDSQRRRPTLEMYEQARAGRPKSQSTPPTPRPAGSSSPADFVDATEDLGQHERYSDYGVDSRMAPVRGDVSPTLSRRSDETSDISEWTEQSYIRQRTIRPREQGSMF